MTFFFIFCIPIITCCILYWNFKKQTALIEYAFVLVPSIILYFLLHFVFLVAKTEDTEYLGGYITSVIYYEPWDEEVWETKTREVPDGVDEDGNTKYRTETYQELVYYYHDAEYYYIDNDNHKHSISNTLYYKIKNKLASPSLFTDLHRSYYRIDGDMYTNKWDGSREHIYTLTTTHLYVNKVQASNNSIFKFHKLSENDIKENKLFDYPEIKELDQKPVLSHNITVSQKEIDDIKFINGYYGKQHQIRLFILLFDTNDKNVADLQRSYWAGGNKNEFVICLGISNNNVNWCRTFSWADDPTLDIKTRDFFRNHTTLNLSAYASYIIPNLKKWHRKEFKDFDYLHIELSNTQLIWIFILIILYNIGISFWIINNDLKQDY